MNTNSQYSKQNHTRITTLNDERAGEIQKLLDMIVQIVDSLETSILSDNKTNIDSSGFMTNFSEAVSGMTLD